MQNPKSVSELLAGAGKKLSALTERARERAGVLEQVRAALPGRLAQSTVSAGIEQGRLIVGVRSAVWASRIRYFSDPLAKAVSAAVGMRIVRVRIRVVPQQTKI